MKNQGITAFFPCYNDEGTIASIVVKMETVLKKLTDDYEIIVVNDASPDESAMVLEALKPKMPKLKIITHKKNIGYGGALISGFKNSTKDLIFYTDGDGQYDVKELELLLPLMKPGIDLVNGFKIKRSDPIHRVILGKMYHYYAKFLFGLKVKDVDCDFRLIRKSALDEIELTRKSGLICIELMKKLQDSGAVIKQVGVHHYHRVHGKSQFFNFPRVFRVLIGIFILWFELVIKKEHLKKHNIRK